MNWAKIEEITYSECDNPHELLGPHKQGSKMLVQAFFPGAEKVTIHWKKTGQVGEAFLADVPMELADEEGYFAALINAGKMAPYEYVVEYGKTEEREAHRMICGDAYRHVPQITKEDMDRFAVGVHYTIYEKLGAHPMELDGESGTYFAVWAPNAQRVQVMGEFNETNNLAFRFADKLILGQSAAMDFTQQMADLLIQLQQLAAVDLIGLQSLGQLLQRELGLGQPRAVRQVGQPGEGAFVVDALMTALLDLPVLLLQGRQILLALLTLLIQCVVPLCRLGQMGAEFCEPVLQCLQPRLALGLAVLQVLHVRVVPQLGIQFG